MSDKPKDDQPKAWRPLVVIVYPPQTGRQWKTLIETLHNYEWYKNDDALYLDIPETTIWDNVKIEYLEPEN